MGVLGGDWGVWGGGYTMMGRQEAGQQGIVLQVGGGLEVLGGAWRVWGGPEGDLEGGLGVLGGALGVWGGV